MGEVIDLNAFDSDLGIEYSKYASDIMKMDLWIVKKSFVYYLDETRTKKVVVPQGFLTDGASVPRVFWGLIPPWGRYGQAAVLHDWLCEYLCYQDGDKTVPLIRREVDNILLAAMADLEVSKLTRFAIWGAVRLYGYVSTGTPDAYNAKKHAVSVDEVAYYAQTGNWK